MVLERVQDELDQLRGQVTGAVVTPEDPGYDEARAVWNAMIDRRPYAVVRAADVGDVVSTIRVARDHRFDLAVRGGGHNVAGMGTVDDGIVLDLGQMNGVSVDPDAATVRVEGGATLADVDAATQPYGLAVPLGVVSATGVAGLTLGGGLGWLTRPHGLTADNLLSVEVVTAGGEHLTAGPDEHADLFWACRGGGGNFGVVTAFTFRAHRHGPDVFSGNLVYGQDRWPEAWAAWERWTRDLPEEMTSTTTTLTPPADMQMGDDPLLVVGFVWASPDRAAGEAVLAGLRQLAPPDIEEVGDNSWVDWQSVLDGLVPKGVRAYWRNASFDRLDEEVVDVLVRHGREQTWTGTAFDVHHLGGAFGRVPEEATAFPNRSARFWINIYGFWDDARADQDRIDFVRGLSADVDRFAAGGQYLNFQGQEPAGHRAVGLRTVFGPAKYQRLVEVKRRYDPDNLFHVNHNIAPGRALSAREG